MLLAWLSLITDAHMRAFQGSMLEVEWEGEWWKCTVRNNVAEDGGRVQVCLKARFQKSDARCRTCV